MTFDEWWDKVGALRPPEGVAEAAWNAACAECVRLLRARSGNEWAIYFAEWLEEELERK